MFLGKDIQVVKSLPGWLILVNSQVRRFANESAPYAVLGGLIQKEGGSAWAIFDEAAREEAVAKQQTNKKDGLPNYSDIALSNPISDITTPKQDLQIQAIPSIRSFPS